jgi:excinuclease ABC subunit A
MSEWKNQLIDNAYRFNFPVHKPYYELSTEQQELLWTGNKWFGGIDQFFKFVEENSYKIQYRVMLARYRGKTICPECKGSRLKKESGYVKVNGLSLQQLVQMPVEKLFDYFRSIELNEHDFKIAQRLLKEINNSLNFLRCRIGLSHTEPTVEHPFGGESQRINLATSLGAG